MIDRASLTAAQGTLKDRYRGDSAAAAVTLRATADLSDDDIACSVATSRAIVTAGLHPATGGSGSLACSGDMLLQALVACAGVTVRAVAANRDIEVTGSVHADGTFDVRGTLGLDRDVPVGFTSIRLTFELASHAEAAELDALVAAAERYCVILQTLTQPIPVDVVRTRR